MNYHLVGLLDAIDSLYRRYNALLEEYGYDEKYGLECLMFIIEARKNIAN